MGSEDEWDRRGDMGVSEVREFLPNVGMQGAG
jgi:hypothetical protein